MKIKQKVFKIFKFVVKIVVAVLIYIILLLPFWLFDMTYKGVIQYTFMVYIVGQIRIWGHFLGLSYSKAIVFLSSSIGILTTSVSLMITLGIHIATRSENKVYGIPRLNLKFNNIAKWYRPISRTIFLGPFFFIYAINCSLCLTGYMVLVYSYIFLAISYFRLNDSFNPKTNSELVARNLVAATDMDQNNNLKEYLEKIRNETIKKENEAEIRLLFETVLKEAENVSFERFYLCCYLFFEIVYMQDDLQKYWGIKFIQRIICTLNKDDVFSYSINKSRKCIALWAMMSCLFDNFSDNLLLVDEFISWCLDIPNESRRDSTGNGICSDVYILIMGMLLIQIECMYRTKKYLKNNIKQLQVIAEYGKDIMQKRNEKLRIQMKCLSNLTGKSTQMVESIKSLEEIENNNYCQSVVFNLLYIVQGEK